MAFSNRLAIIVGGIGGIGSATGKLLRSKGIRLALLHHPSEHHKVKPTLQEFYNIDSSSPEIQAIPCDITSLDSVQQAFSTIQKSSNPKAIPNILINAAGYVNLTALEQVPLDDIVRHYNINLLGPTLTGQAFANLYFSLAPPKPQGRIINIASQAAHIALHHHGPYCASKAGLLGLTKCMASEWAGRGITANTISPGPVMTELGKKAWGNEKVKTEYLAQVPTGRFASPEEVASAIEFLCSDSSSSINGADIRLDGGFTIY